MSSGAKVYKGNIIFTKEACQFTCVRGGYIPVTDGKVVDVFNKLPEAYKDAELIDFGDKLIIPGFIDTHMHAPQFENVGLGLDKELLQWLTTYTFPEENRFADLEYAEKVYTRFADELIKQGTTRAVVFATVHTAATEKLFEILDARGITAFVGRVNMDRNGDCLTENTADSLRETEEWLQRHSSPDARVKPIITPRFTPSCTDELMSGLGRLASKYNVPVQSHISENRAEVEWVKELAPTAKHYADTYDRFGLFGVTPTIMAHCVYLTDEEIELMRTKGVFASHCPMSNLNIKSGVAPIRQFLRNGVKVALGTDISGGHTLSMPETIVSAVHSSKMYDAHLGENSPLLTLPEAFYMATKAGGEFFAPSPAGSFEPGYGFDALVIDDTGLPGANAQTLHERIERYIYTGSFLNIYKRFASGKEI